MIKLYLYKICILIHDTRGKFFWLQTLALLRYLERRREGKAPGSMRALDDALSDFSCPQVAGWLRKVLNRSAKGGGEEIADGMQLWAQFT